jgi:uncharacterized protein YbjT (DUF2867 family)
MDAETLAPALKGVNAAYYLVHNMSSGRHYEHRETESARNFATAAEIAGLQRIIYLGGLAHREEKISAHMLSRLRTGDMLRQGKVPIIEFQASLIIGSGSISFEMIRYLVEQLPLIIGPAHFHNLTQPIAINDVLAYLLAAMKVPARDNQIFELGGKETLSYAEAMLTYAKIRGLKRSTLTLPWVPRDLMAGMVGILTPIPTRIARPLIGGMKSNSTVHHSAAHKIFPDIQPLTYQKAVLAALEKLSPSRLGNIAIIQDKNFHITRGEGFFIDRRTALAKNKPEIIFHYISSMGGRNGWPFMNWLWQIRGTLDKWLGGPGLRGREKETVLGKGDVVDYYRVEAVKPGKMLRLKAELKAPGQGWMEWCVCREGEDSRIIQTAFFAPKGLSGYLYWYFLWPIHTLVFAGTIRKLSRNNYK